MKPCVSWLSICLIGLFVDAAAAQFNDLLTRVPSHANALIVLNVEKIHATPLAQQENWREQQEKAFEGGLTIVPPHSDYFLMAGQMDFEFMQSSWEVALTRVSDEPSLPKIAAKWNGSIDRIERRGTVRLPNDAYLVKFGKEIVGVMRPANRQSVARWLKQVDSNGGQHRLSPYLKEAVGFAQNQGTPIIMALDLQNAVSAEFLRRRFAEDDKLKATDIDVDQLVDVLSSIRGVTLGITIRNELYGAIKVDFEKDVTVLGDLAKPMLLEALARHSAMIDEFEDWKTTVQGTQIRIGGKLYPSGLRRILSLLDAPASLQQMETASDPQQSEQDQKRLASQQYFQTVTQQVADLRGRDGQTMGQVGIWCGRAARKIDQLPLLNVDEELLEYGAFVSEGLRQAESVLRSVGGRTRVRQTSQTGGSSSYDYGYSYGYGRWGAYGRYGVRDDARAEQQQRTAIATQERFAGATSTRQIMQQIDTATAEVRRKMVAKYQAEF